MPIFRIFVADDHEMVRRVIAALLGPHPGWEICGEAANGQEAVRVAELNPDIVLMDIDMPNLGGLEATRQIVQNHPSRKVIVLTMTATEQIVRDIFRAGALGFVNKPNATHDLVAAIEAVQRGRTFFTARFAETVLKSYLEEERLQGANEPDLTERERTTIRLLTDEMNMTVAQQWRKPKVAGKAARYAAIFLIVLTFAGVGWYVLNGEPEHATPILDNLFVSLGLKLLRCPSSRGTRMPRSGLMCTLRFTSVLTVKASVKLRKADSPYSAMPNWTTSNPRPANPAIDAQSGRLGFRADNKPGDFRHSPSTRAQNHLRERNGALL